MSAKIKFTPHKLDPAYFKFLRRLHGHCVTKPREMAGNLFATLSSLFPTFQQDELGLPKASNSFAFAKIYPRESLLEACMVTKKEKAARTSPRESGFLLELFEGFGRIDQL